MFQIELVEIAAISKKEEDKMKQDILFMTWNCTDCCRIKVEFEQFSKYAFSDEDLGKQGQNLVVVQTYSNAAARFVFKELGDFGDEDFTPGVLTCDQRKITDVEEIISYLKENYGN